LLLVDHYPNWLELYNTDRTIWDSYVPDTINIGLSNPVGGRKGTLVYGR